MPRRSPRRARPGPSIGPTVPTPDGTKSSVNGDFVVQGLGNIGGGLFGALPTGGSMSRTGVAVSAGAAPAGPGSSPVCGWPCSS